MYANSRRLLLVSGFALVSMSAAQAQISLPFAPTLALAPVTALTFAPNVAPTIGIALTGTLAPVATGSSLIHLPAGPLLPGLGN